MQQARNGDKTLMIIVLLVLEKIEGFNYKISITPISKVAFSNVLYVNELLVKIALAHYVFLKIFLQGRQLMFLFLNGFGAKRAE